MSDILPVQHMETQVLSSSSDGQPFGHNRHRPKIRGCGPFWERGAIAMIQNVAWADAYLLTKWHLDPPIAVWPQ